jgi:hypothetical protein
VREGYAMKHKIIDIRRSLEYECFHSALALALTLPDVCGMIKYPYESRVGVRYINWFNEYVYPFYHHPNACEQYANTMEFTGSYCYQLRCKYLHEGHIDIHNHHEVKVDKFVLCLSSDNHSGIYADSYNIELDMDCPSPPFKYKYTTIRIDVRRLCKCICNAAEQFYNEYNDKSVFHEHSVEFINIENEIMRFIDNKDV